ncbi:hypothetical protein NS44R_14935, partial [Mammaliicoccus sciuri]
GDDLARALGLDAVDRSADPVERVRQHRQQRQPLVGEHQPARQAAEQARAEQILQLLDLMADRGLRHAQLHPRAGEAQQPRRGLEGAQSVQWEVPAHGVMTKFFSCLVV